MYTKELDEAVAAAREHREWRLEYMKMEAWEQDIRRESREEGEIQRLVTQVCKKMKLGQSLEKIAEDLVEEVSAIEPIYDIAGKYEPEYDPESVMEELAAAGPRREKE